MSTRSGKRIHGSIHENIAIPDNDIVVKSERKTRNRRLKENCDEAVPRSKKRHNYVSYPGDEEQSDNTTKIQTNRDVTAKASKTTLKEQDLNVSVKTVDEIDSGKVVRQTRRTKKISENIPEEVPVVEIENVKSKKKNKKNKKKKGVTQVDSNENEVAAVVPKKSKRKKRRTNDSVTDIPEAIAENVIINKSNGSIDSFHSAAGSPMNDDLITDVEKPNGSLKKLASRASKRSKADSCDDIDSEAETQIHFSAKKSKKMKLSNHDNKSEVSNELLKSDDKCHKKKNETCNIPDEANELPEIVLNTTFEKESQRKRKSSIKNTFNKNEIELSCTYEKLTPKKFDDVLEEKTKGRRKSLRSTYDKSETPAKEVAEINVTYEKDDVSNETNETLDREKSRKKSLRSTYDKTDTPKKETKKLNSTFEKNNTPSENTNGRRKSLHSTFDKTETPPKLSKEPSLSSGKANTPSKPNITLEETNRVRRMSVRLSMSADKQAEKGSLNITFENPKASINGTLNKSENSQFNSTFDKSKDSQRSATNSMFEKSKDSRGSMKNTTFDNSKDSKATINTTFEKSDSEQSSLNSTFDKEPNLNSTFDKPGNQESNAKSSIISSDSASNLTFDKSDEMSHTSITSDDSRTENIINTTPVLIESSMDESKVLDSSAKDESQSSDDTKLKTSTTPLKREGTFTKDGPEVVPTSPKVSLNKTPVKRMSLPSPGSTPFPFSKSSQKEKSMLNVTRSIEKSVRRSSLVEAAPRQTRVMFCSPVNNPAVVMQQKRKVIKSNLKGSNKSFIFDESVSESVRPAGRKRSYTQNDADDARAKRKRIADDQLHSVARLSRPRTSSVTVKLPEPSTPSKNATPRKTGTPNAKSEAKVSRTKLPNFAALHQKQFAKMESLDECQVRKAKRARQLLTPTGALAIIEKSSPKGRATTVAAESTKPVKEVTKKSDAKVSRKTDTDVPKKAIDILKKTEAEASTKQDTPSKAPKPFTMDSLRPGYTRFGFKMNLDVNPFSIPPKTDVKTKETKPNGLVTRQPSQPSLTGTTTGRREVAKQIVMRERSFTSLSDKRNQKRTTIKGVRTNRRFELQMKMRNINS